MCGSNRTMFAIVTILECLVGGWSDLTSKCALGNAFVSESFSGHERQLCMTTVCVLPYFCNVQRHTHRCGLYSCCLHGTYISRFFCELSKLGTLLTWVGVPEANALAIRKEWFSIFGANETGAASVTVRLPPDKRTQGSGCK